MIINKKSMKSFKKKMNKLNKIKTNFYNGSVNFIKKKKK